jgi:hypothetical protein
MFSSDSEIGLTSFIITAIVANVSWAVWLPIIISASVAVFGVVTWSIAQRQRRKDTEAGERKRREDAARAAGDAERQRADDYYRNVLLPLRHGFEVSGDVSRSLLIEPYFADLEYPPSQLASVYEGLPANDYRRDSWRNLVDQLQENNQRALELIRKGVGSFSPEMRDAAREFEAHAAEWRSVWEAKQHPPPPPAEGTDEETRRARPFPKQMIETLEKEIADVDARRRGGDPALS